MKKKKVEPPQFSSDEISNGEELKFSWDYPTAQARYTYRLEGTDYGKRWAIHMTRSAAKRLALMILEGI